jgi:hypothetical protein
MRFDSAAADGLPPFFRFSGTPFDEPLVPVGSCPAGGIGNPAEVDGCDSRPERPAGTFPPFFVVSVAMRSSGET